jgi:AmmeMemoRadiSam system protein A
MKNGEWQVIARHSRPDHYHSQITVALNLHTTNVDDSSGGDVTDAQRHTCGEQQQVEQNDLAQPHQTVHASLSAQDKGFLLSLARQVLVNTLSHARLPALATHSPALMQPRATFVTLWQRSTGDLRGCRGECFARHALIESVAQMVLAAALDDPRFPPVSLDEVDDLRIEINALTPLALIDPAAVVVGRHGLMLVVGNHAGLLLPDVPVRLSWHREEFLIGLCHKAGLPGHAWRLPGAQLYSFETEEWGENET